MSNFFQNLPYKLANFMAGRNGPDALARASLWMGVLFTFLEIITGLGICSLIGMVFLLYFMFRCFSRNIAARTRENADVYKRQGRLRRRLPCGSRARSSPGPCRTSAGRPPRAA